MGQALRDAQASLMLTTQQAMSELAQGAHWWTAARPRTTALLQKFNGASLPTQGRWACAPSLRPICQTWAHACALESFLHVSCHAKANSLLPGLHFGSGSLSTLVQTLSSDDSESSPRGARECTGQSWAVKAVAAVRCAKCQSTPCSNDCSRKQAWLMSAGWGKPDTGGHAAKSGGERGQCERVPSAGKHEVQSASKPEEFVGSTIRTVGEAEQQILNMLSGLNALVSSLRQYNQRVVDAGNLGAMDLDTDDAKGLGITKLCQDLEGTVSSYHIRRCYRASGRNVRQLEAPGPRMPVGGAKAEDAGFENADGTVRQEGFECPTQQVGEVQADGPKDPDQSKTEEAVKEEPAVCPRNAPPQTKRRPSCEAKKLAPAAAGSERTGPKSAQSVQNLDAKRGKWEMPASKAMTRGTKTQPYRTPDGR